MKMVKSLLKVKETGGISPIEPIIEPRTPWPFDLFDGISVDETGL